MLPAAKVLIGRLAAFTIALPLYACGEQEPSEAVHPPLVADIVASSKNCELPLLHLRTFETLPPEQLKNNIDLTRSGQVKWNDTPISERNLEYYLAQLRQIEPPSAILLNSDRLAPCQNLARVLYLLQKEQACASNGCLFSWKTLPHDPDALPPPRDL